MRVLSAMAVALPAAAVAATTATAQAVANMGTLTCVASTSEKDLLGPDRRLNCTFDPLTGAKANLVGMIKRDDESRADSDAKIVLMWSVVGPKVDTSVKQLEGSYRGAPGSQTKGLLGGAGGDIALKPLSPEPAIRETAALAVLELQLAAIKA